MLDVTTVEMRFVANTALTAAGLIIAILVIVLILICGQQL